MSKRAKKPRRRKSKPDSPAERALIGSRIQLDISDMAHGGRGLGWHRGKPVFVPHTLPGETISAEITSQRKGALFARGLRLMAASADRIAPVCPHFGPGACFGCQWQHIAYPAQLLLKQDILADQLSRLGKLPDALIESALRPVLPAAQLWHYNSAISLRRAGDGGWGLQRDGGGNQAISECHLTQPELLDMLARLDLDYPSARRLSLRRGSDGRMMLIFALEREHAPELQTDLPVSVNLILPDREPVNLIGDAHSHYRLRGRSFRVTAGASMRANIAGVERLVDEAMRLLGIEPGMTALDLYAGAGIFSAFMAQAAALVTLVESYPPAVSDADRNLSDADNVDVIEGSVEATLADMTASGARYDLALLDPPSAGLSDAVIHALSRLGLSRLVYISGDAGSLARDCAKLLAAGFGLSEIQPMDLAPHTAYITAIARFER